MTLARPIDRKRRALSIASRDCHPIHFKLPEDALGVHGQPVDPCLDSRDRDFATGADIAPILSNRCDNIFAVLAISHFDRECHTLTIINGILEVYPDRRQDGFAIRRSRWQIDLSIKVASTRSANVAWNKLGDLIIKVSGEGRVASMSR